MVRISANWRGLNQSLQFVILITSKVIWKFSDDLYLFHYPYKTNPRRSIPLWTDTNRTTLINIPIFTHNGRYYADLHPQRPAGCAARTDIPLLYFPTRICLSVSVWRAMVIGKGILGAGRYFGFQIQSLRDLVAASRRNHFACAEPIVYRPDAGRDLPLLPPYAWIQVSRWAYLRDGYGGIYFRAGQNGWPANRITDFASDIWKTPLFIERVGWPMGWLCWRCYKLKAWKSRLKFFQTTLSSV